MGATVAWQVVTLVAGALVIGLPLGSLVGRSAWLAFARQLGVASDVTLLPVPTVVAVGAGALGVALVAAVVPATIAARMRSTRVLHSE
jgi:ABC-type lipoprotein release transport system permease subunit